MWSIIWTGEWWANVGIPLILAVIGLIGAICAVGIQLDSDRKAATMDRRHAQAQRFAEVLDTGAERLEIYASEVRSDGSHLNFDTMYTKVFKLLEPVGRAGFRAEEKLGKSDAIKDVARFRSTLPSRLNIWVGEANALEGEYEVLELRGACACLLDIYAQALHLTADALEDWDGSNALPVSSARGPQEPVNIPIRLGTQGVLLPPSRLFEEVPSDNVARNKFIEEEKRLFKRVLKEVHRQAARGNYVLDH